MELVLSTKNFEPVPKHNEDYINRPSGFLTSQYKTIVKQNYSKQKPTSIFGIKQCIKSRSYSINNLTETTLKLSLFLITIVLIFN